MTKYNIEIREIPGFTVLGYLDGRVCLISFEHSNLSDLHVAKFLSRFPLHERDLEAWKRREPNITITKQPQDLSFERFWTVYNYKVGKKSKSEKLWNEMTLDERSAALVAVVKYNKWMNSKSIEKAYPETWLSQKRWENEYKI